MPRLRGAPVLRRGRSVRVQLGGNAGYGSAPSELPVPARSSRAASPPRSSPSCWEGANTNHQHHPEETCSSSVFVFLQHFSLMSFCFVLSCFGGLSGVQESKHKTKSEVGRWGVGEQGAVEAPGPQRPPQGCRVHHWSSWPSWEVSCCSGML